METSAQQMVSLTIDGKQVSVPKGTLILNAAKQVDIEIPIFCYHDKLKPIGACRMCIVNVEGQPKPVPSCATEVREGMVVTTNSPEVRKNWESVLEFLLINHPLDCPVCDRGGECPLQDNTFKYGPPDSRFTQEKRHFAKPVPLSRYVTLDRERCIMCTRCVRFCEEISEDEQLKIWDRGHREYIDTFPGKEFDSNFSGNTIELCPVGALTSSVFRFRARPWDMKSTPSICPHCAVGCNIRVDVRNNREVVRFLSRENAEVDNGWLCDRGRFDSDFPNRADRLTKPLLRKNGELVEVEWDEALDAVAAGLKAAGDQVGAIGSPWRTNEENYLLQKLLREAFKSNNLDFTFDPRPYGVDALAEAYREGLFDGTIADITTAEAVYVVGTDVSTDAPILDLWLKKAARNGTKIVYNFPADDAEKALVLVGLAALDQEALENLRKLKAKSQLRICPVISQTNAQGAMDAGLLPGYLPGYQSIGDGSAMSGTQMLEAAREGKLQAMYIMGNGLGDDAVEALGNVPFLVVADTFLTETAKLAHVVLPSCTFTEKDGTFTNTERRVQRINQAMRVVSDSRPDWVILKDLSERLGVAAPYERVEDVLEEMARVIPQYAGMDYESIGEKGAHWKIS